MVNRERIQLLRDTLAALPDEKFNIRWLFTHNGPTSLQISEVAHTCGSAACIAGYVGILFKPDEQVGDFDSRDAARLLGLEQTDADALFEPFAYAAEPERYTREAAIATLDHLLETGDVLWDV